MKEIKPGQIWRHRDGCQLKVYSEPPVIHTSCFNEFNAISAAHWSEIEFREIFTFVRDQEDDIPPKGSIVECLDKSQVGYSVGKLECEKFLKVSFAKVGGWRWTTSNWRVVERVGE